MPKTKSPKPINYTAATDHDLFVLSEHAKEDRVRAAAKAERASRARYAAKAAAHAEQAAEAAKNAAILGIAQSILSLETLEIRGTDRQDFSEHAVWTLKAALELAYATGKASK